MCRHCNNVSHHKQITLSAFFTKCLSRARGLVETIKFPSHLFSYHVVISRSQKFGRTGATTAWDGEMPDCAQFHHCRSNHMGIRKGPKKFSEHWDPPLWDWLACHHAPNLVVLDQMVRVYKIRRKNYAHHVPSYDSRSLRITETEMDDRLLMTSC